MILKGIDQQQWGSIAPYVDTLLLPIAPVKLAAKELHLDAGLLIDELASDLETKLTGRLLLLPSIFYIGEDRELFASYLNRIVTEMLDSGFTYLILLADQTLADLLSEVEEVFKEATGLRMLIYTVELSEEEPTTELEPAKEELYQKVLQMWG